MPFSVSCPACAEVTVNMEDRVEVLRRQMAQITCNFVSAEGIGGMIIHWFYVSGAWHASPHGDALGLIAYESLGDSTR